MIIVPEKFGRQNSAYRHLNMKGAFGNEGALRFLYRTLVRWQPRLRHRKRSWDHASRSGERASRSNERQEIDPDPDPVRHRPLTELDHNRRRIKTAMIWLNQATDCWNHPAEQTHQ